MPNANRLIRRIDELTAVVQPLFEEERLMKQRGSQSADELKQNIAERARFLGFSSRRPVEPSFPANGQLWVEDWESADGVVGRHETNDTGESRVTGHRRREGLESWPVDIQPAPRSGNVPSGGSSAL